MKVPQPITLFKVHMPEAVDKPLLDVLHSGYITQGSKVEEFEQKFADTFGLKKDQIVSVNSGTSALTLALRLAGVKAGDEVITTAMTCTATNLPILAAGATPVFADVDPKTGLIRPADIEGRIRPNTKAIMAVDWAGLPVDVKALMEIGRRHNLKVIVDAAHALGTVHNEQPDFACYSLQAIKHITTGDGGVLVCRDAGSAEVGKRLRWFGIDRSAGGKDSRIDQDIAEWGYKFHMNDIAATIGIVQLDFIKQIVTSHQRNAAYYLNNLDDYYIKPPFEGATWLYTILLPDRAQRNHFIAMMNEWGVAAGQVHKRNDEYTVFKPFANSSSPGLDAFADRMACIPVHWALSQGEVELIVTLCNKYAKEQTS